MAYNPSWKCKISFHGHHNKYICADNQNIVVNRDKIADWEKFIAVPLENGKYVAILTHFQKYFSAQPNGTLEGNRTEVKDWEKFIIEPVGNNKYSIQSMAHKKYLSAQPNGNLEINRDKVQDWEKFTIIIHEVIEKPNQPQQQQQQQQQQHNDDEKQQAVNNAPWSHPYYFANPTTILLQSVNNKNKSYFRKNPNMDNSLLDNNGGSGGWAQWEVAFKNNGYLVTLKNVVYKKWLLLHRHNNNETLDCNGGGGKFCDLIVHYIDPNNSIYAFEANEARGIFVAVDNNNNPTVGKNINDPLCHFKVFQEKTPEPFTLPYFFLQPNIILLKAVAIEASTYLRKNPNMDNSLLDNNGGTGGWAQWEVTLKDNGSLVTLKNVVYKKWLLLHNHGSNQLTLNCEGGGGKFCDFIVHKEKNGTVRFESSFHKGSFVAVDNNGPRVGTGGKFCYFRVYRQH